MLAPLSREVRPEVETLNVGPKCRPAHPETANGAETWAWAPCAPVIVAVTCSCAQSVGLKMNPGRSIVTFAVRSRSGIPSITCGNASLVTVNAAVLGSTAIRARTTTLPRLNGPATVGTTIDRPNGEPRYGPVK